MKKLALYKCFNPRTHTGCDCPYFYDNVNYSMFQSTHPHGVRQSGMLAVPITSGFQSTHPHGVRLIINGIFPILISVSIHAPTRGATYKPNLDYIEVYSFNPRTHTGCDSQYVPPTKLVTVVSIHAPTRGATFIRLSTAAPRASFNPRTHTGCDELTERDGYKFIVSIHAPTRGATP